MGLFTEQDNILLDKIIATRRSVRQFKDEIPPKEKIEAIIDAGMKAPFASVSANDVDIFRHFYVITRKSGLLPKFDRLIREQSRTDLEGLEKEMEVDPFIKDHGNTLHGLWSMVAEKGIPGFLNSPYFIVVAEWAGARRAAKQSLAHVMENMWLKATALELGFVLVSPIEGMVNNEAFCKIFDLPSGRYGFHACIIGYPRQDLDKMRGKPVKGAVVWF